MTGFVRAGFGRNPFSNPNFSASGYGWICDPNVVLVADIIEFFRGRPRRGDNFTFNFPGAPDPFFSKRQNYAYLKTCHPVGGTPKAPLEDTAWEGLLAKTVASDCDYNCLVCRCEPTLSLGTWGREWARPPPRGLPRATAQRQMDDSSSACFPLHCVCGCVCSLFCSLCIMYITMVSVCSRPAKRRAHNLQGISIFFVDCMLLLSWGRFPRRGRPCVSSVSRTLKTDP